MVIETSKSIVSPLNAHLTRPIRHCSMQKGAKAACNLQYHQYIIRRDRIMGVMNFGLSKIELKYR